MITTNLTLTNGSSSQLPVEVSGVTFEVDSKLAVNPAVVFPFTIDIGSSEVIGIDFDDSLYTGDFTEQIVINTTSGQHEINHTVNINDIATAPTTINNLVATDDEIGQVTMTFTPATGYPAPTHNLYENDIEVATNIGTGYSHQVSEGEYTYHVLAVNRAGSKESNDSVGKSLPSLAEPVPIIDLVASDDEYNQVTITFTPAAGNPIPTQDLYEDDIEVATNIPDGYIHSVANGTKSYKVKSFNSEAPLGIDSNSDDGTSLEGLSAPSAITDFEAIDGIDEITITFSDAVGNPTPAYDLINVTTDSLVASGVSSGSIHFVDNGTYTFRLDAINSEGTVPSNEDSATSSAPLTLPSAIVDFVADDGYNEISYTFTPSTGNPTPTHRLLENGTEVSDNVVSGDKYTQPINGTYEYSIEAYNSQGVVESNPDSAESLLPLAPPSAINDFEAFGGLEVVLVDFTDAAGNPEPTYDLYEDSVLLQSNIAKNTNYSTTVGAHSYYVRAINSQGEVNSNTNNALVAQSPSAILDFEATDDEEGQIIMTFTPAVGVPNPHHNLFEGGVEIAQNIPSGYIHVIAESTNTYRVDAINIAGTVPSNDDSGTSVPGAPALTPPTEILNFSASDEDELTITMNFTNSTGNPIPTHALFEDNIAVVGAENISDGYVHTPAIVGTYTYRVDAINSEGTQPSNDDSGTCTPDYTLPTVIDDFLATDGVGEVVMTFTEATGNPAPTHALYEDNIQIVVDIDTDYVHTVVEGTRTYRVDAINSQGTVSSNDDDGTSEADTPSSGASVFYDGFMTTTAGVDKVCRDEIGNYDLVYPETFMSGYPDGVHDGLVIVPTDVPMFPIEMLDTELGNRFVFEFVIQRVVGDSAYIMYSRHDDDESGLEEGMRIYASSSDSMVFMLYDSAGNGPSASASMPDSDLHYITMRFDGTIAEVYLDGFLEDTEDYSVLPFTPSGYPLASSGDGLDGTIRMLKIWKEDVYDDYDVATEYQNAIDAGYLT